MFLRRSALALCLSLPFAACFTQSTAAQKAQVSKDEAELQSYTLTMENVTHAMQATAAANEAAKKDPALRGSMKNSDSDESQQSIDAMAAKLASSPKLVAIFASYNLTPRQYSITLMALITTGIAVTAIDMGAKQEEVVASAHVNPANITFVRAHKAELEELGKKYPMQSSD